MFKLYISKASNLLKISAVVILLCIAAGSTAKPAYFSAGSFNLSDSAKNQADTAYLNLPVPAQLTDSLVNDSADNTQNKPKAVLGINTQSGAQTVVSQPVLGVVKSENSGSNPIETPVQKAAESIVNFSEPLPIKTGNTIRAPSPKTDSRVYSFTVSQRGYIVLNCSTTCPPPRPKHGMLCCLRNTIPPETAASLNTEHLQGRLGSEGYGNCRLRENRRIPR